MGVIFFGIGDIGGCKLLCGFLEMNLGKLCELMSYFFGFCKEFFKEINKIEILFEYSRF